MTSAQTPPRGTRPRLARFFSAPGSDVLRALEAQIVHTPHPYRAVAVLIVGMVVTWWVYVPVHELLHAAGCWLPGGTVSELQIAPEYGGALLTRWFPFITAGGDYAGRLSGFDTHGSDLIYLATDALPFVLSIVPGVPLLVTCTRGRRPFRFGAAIVLAFAPFYSLFGDYYEMGSILVTRGLTLVGGGGALRWPMLRSDDTFKLVSDVWADPQRFGIASPGAAVAAASVIVSALLTGIALAFATYAAGRAVAARFGAGAAVRTGPTD